MDIESVGRPIRIAGFVEKTDSETGALISVDHDATTWYEADGSEVTSPERIAELEAGIAEREKEATE